MTRLVFATNNKHKFEEIKSKTTGNIELLSLNDIGFFEEIAETQGTIEGNAIQKAVYIYEKFGIDCFADDTGLEVDALNGAPGVYSARYAGEKATYHENVMKLLKELENTSNRKARFRSCIALIKDAKQILFEGIIEGEIIRSLKGEMGFGYDPVFKPLGYDLTFAEMDLAAKNKISHRALAVNKLVDYLKKNY